MSHWFPQTLKEAQCISDFRVEICGILHVLCVKPTYNFTNVLYDGLSTITTNNRSDIVCNKMFVIRNYEPKSVTRITITVSSLCWRRRYSRLWLGNA